VNSQHEIQNGKKFNFNFNAKTFTPKGPVHDEEQQSPSSTGFSDYSSTILDADLDSTRPSADPKHFYNYNHKKTKTFYPQTH
jgi:hypothetical protein